jgi:hypothetical protein
MLKTCRSLNVRRFDLKLFPTTIGAEDDRVTSSLSDYLKKLFILLGISCAKLLHSLRGSATRDLTTHG